MMRIIYPAERGLPLPYQHKKNNDNNRQHPPGTRVGVSLSLTLFSVNVHLHCPVCLLSFSLRHPNSNRRTQWKIHRTAFESSVCGTKQNIQRHYNITNIACVLYHRILACVQIRIWCHNYIVPAAMFKTIQAHHSAMFIIYERRNEAIEFWFFFKTLVTDVAWPMLTFVLGSPLLILIIVARKLSR